MSFPDASPSNLPIILPRGPSKTAYAWACLSYVFQMEYSVIRTILRAWGPFGSCFGSWLPVGSVWHCEQAEEFWYLKPFSFQTASSLLDTSAARAGATRAKLAMLSTAD